MASQNHAGAPPASKAVRAAGRPGRHGRPSALRASVHTRLEEMRFSRGVLLMVTVGAVVVAVVVGVAMAFTGGKGKTPAEPPMADSSSSRSASAGPTGRTPSPHATRRPRTSSSTRVGVPAAPPSETSHPQSASTAPAGPPTWWPRDSDRYRRWHGSPPPWWRHH